MQNPSLVMLYRDCQFGAIVTRFRADQRISVPYRYLGPRWWHGSHIAIVMHANGVGDCKNNTPRSAHLGEGVISDIESIGIDPNSTIGSELQRELMALAKNGALTTESMAFAVTLAIARLEACIFGGLEDPTVEQSRYPPA